MRNALFRVRAYIRHLLTAINTRGEGVHSPYLFYLVDKILYDKNAYYCFSEIERLRNAMAKSEKTIHKNDFGTGKQREKKLCDITRQELEQPRVAQLLFRITQWLSHDSNKPLNIIELGTSLGITTAYLASADKTNRVTTMEGCGEVADIAQKNHQKLSLKNIRIIRGNIDEQLPLWVESNPSVDIAYIDANHTYEATLQYYKLIGTRAHDKSLFILDDIHYSAEMERAWNELCAREEVTSSMDLYHIGLLFFDPHYIKRNYKLLI